MPSVTFLGTGPGDCQPGRFQTGILLQTDSANVLLDAGEPCTAQLLNVGLPLPDIDAVWITHAHADHIGGLPMFLQASYCHGRVDSLPVGLPRHLLSPLQDWLRAILLVPGIVGFPIDYFSWQPGVSRTFQDITVTPYSSSHLDQYRARLGRDDLEAFLFDISFSGKRIIFSGDIGAASDLQPLLASPIDLLICEMSHVPPEALIETLQPATIATVCFTHLSAEADERRGELKLKCARTLSGDTYFPADGERIDL